MCVLNRLNDNSEFVTETGCQIWLGAVIKDTGYGVIKIDGKVKKVHRAMFECVHGKIRKNNVIRHRCGVQLCINPSHLMQGTQRQNIRDKKRPWY